MCNIWAVILAAGESKRMGKPKMLLPFGNSTMLERVIDCVKDSKVDGIMVVLGNKMEEIAHIIAKSSVMYCYNENYKEGMLSSVICGVRNVPPEADAIMIFQGDQPLIKPVTVNIVIENYTENGKDIVIPVFEKKRGHPLLIGKKFRNEIEKLDPEKGLRSLATAFSNDVLEVETDDPGILRDFDTYEEYKLEIN